MIQRTQVWDTKHAMGDVVIASFYDQDDAILFAKTKASKQGGYTTSLLVGVDIATRRVVAPD